MTDRPVVVQLPEKKVDYMAKINSAFSDFENVLSERSNKKTVVAAAFKRRATAAVDSDDSDSDDASDNGDDCENAGDTGGSDAWKSMMSKYL